MESNGVSDFSFACHEMNLGHEEGDEDERKISNREPCACEPLKCPARTVWSTENFGSTMDFSKVNWPTGTVEGNIVQVHHNLRYEDTPHMRGIVLGRPILFLTKSFRIHKGRVYQLV